MAALRLQVNEGGGFLLSRGSNRRKQGVFVWRTTPPSTILQLFLMLGTWLCDLHKLWTVSTLEQNGAEIDPCCRLHATKMSLPAALDWPDGGSSVFFTPASQTTEQGNVGPAASGLNADIHFTMIGGFVMLEKVLLKMAPDRKCSSGSESSHLPPHLRVKEKVQEGISGTTSRWTPRTFYDCWEKWIWTIGNSPYLSSRQPHFPAPCSLLPRSQWLPRCGGSYFTSTTGQLQRWID